MKLYFKPGACALSPRIALNEAGLSYQTEAVDLVKKVTASGKDFRAINPKGYIPALELDDGTLLTEGTAIVLYIAQLAPEAKLAPPVGTSDYFKVLEWLVFIATELHKGCSPFFNPAVGDEARASFRDRLKLRLSTADSLLKGPYVLGDAFTVADGYLFNILNWLPATGLELASFPKLAAFHQTVGARPAVQKAIAEERA